MSTVVTDSLRAMILYQMALFTLSCLAIITLGGSLFLAYNHIAIPESIVAMGAASVGALAGLFAPSPLPKAE